MKCPSCNYTKPRTHKPKPGGREITSDSYKNELATYTNKRKEFNDTSKITPSSPRSSTSGLQINRPDVAMETENDDDELNDTVCKQITLPNLSIHI
ncbi:hypothetical protein DPMN_087060 [Dreissena polymorpha]|uniref:Uncharacterized protein n=1 Tax=Dreissena polymorpha TaxID=45954 RepID=A0A9D4QVR5_DREPO|nr:hypothetical protein DPMN_087060 [Dreissena polymorpha]